MIKIIKATYINSYKIKIEFSDHHFLEMGAICWKNGLELSPSSLYLKAKESANLHKNEIAA